MIPPVHWWYSFSAGDLISDDDSQKVHVGHLLLDGLAVTRFDRIHDPRQAKLLEHRS